ncbi:siderophore-interacting protein [Longispora sp. NPDC051575]|uniref:siderophore-interacting protein n=1 Tax=Longispora sp. NPDC051575 TaxID=3154943 RepID=UPI0034133E33
MSLLDLFLMSGTVESVRTVGRRFRRIRLRVPRMFGVPWKPGQQVRVNVATSGLTLRTYSVWDLADSMVDLCALDHGEGPGAAWARSAAPGQLVRFTKPQGDLVLRPAPFHLFVGDETASVAFGPMLRALPADAAAFGAIEVDRPEDALPLGSSITWSYREGRPAASSAGLVAAVAALDLPPGPGVAYVAGEARTVQAVRSHLVRERGWARRAVVTKPFWTPGKKGMD